MNGRDIKLISGNSNLSLTSKISKILNIPISETLISTFSDGETRVEIYDNMRGCDVFVIQPTSPPTNDNFMELCLILDALKRSNCWRVTAVIPYFGYARQDKKLKPRVPISAKAIADMIQVVGVDRILTLDLHANQIQGYFNCPVDNLFASSIFINHIESYIDKENTVIVSPDEGGMERSVHYSKKLGTRLAMIHKSRNNPNEVSEMVLLGNVRGMTAIIIDDMIDTAGTLSKASTILKDAGAVKIIAYASHGIFSGNAITNINNSNFDTIHVTDSINGNKYFKQLEILSCSKLFADAILNIHDETSVSCLFD